VLGVGNEGVAVPRLQEEVVRREEPDLVGQVVSLCGPRQAGEVLLEDPALLPLDVHGHRVLGPPGADLARRGVEASR
jgi:hypothetical protein